MNKLNKVQVVLVLRDFWLFQAFCVEEWLMAGCMKGTSRKLLRRLTSHDLDTMGLDALLQESDVMNGGRDACSVQTCV